MNASVCLCVLCALIAAAAVFYALKALRTLRGLERMVDAVERGTFQAQRYDESRLSRLEARMEQILRSAALTQARLEDERARIKGLIGDISHQTKNPLANVVLYAQLLCEQSLPPEASDMAQRIALQSEKLRFLIAALVKLSRLEAGALKMRAGSRALGPIAREAADAFAAQAGSRSVSLAVAQGDDAAVCDARWTREALEILIDNAVKYTRPGGCVRVAVGAHASFSYIDVSDDGSGIPEEEQARVFERFYRGSQSGAAEGVGIGLYLARQIARAQGGYIRLRSAPGAGAVFTLFLPRAEK